MTKVEDYFIGLPDKKPIVDEEIFDCHGKPIGTAADINATVQVCYGTVMKDIVVKKNG
jgi:hypothetical protein